LILGRDFHLQQDEIDLKKCDLAELCAEEPEIREKFGLLEDTPLHDVTQAGQPAAVSCGDIAIVVVSRVLGTSNLLFFWIFVALAC
jgi:hypothetical protein